MLASNPFKYLYGEYEYNTSLIDFVEGYFIIDDIEMAESLSIKIALEFSKRLELYSQFSTENQLQLVKRIKDEFLNYQYLLQQTKIYGSNSFYKQQEKEYNKSKALFTEMPYNKFSE